jgi:mRNA-degrading endonuclease RelE of RelBE toxin-antitoxin system
MSYNVEITKLFNKQAKRLIKKFPSFKSELTELILSLELEPTQGTSLGNNNYKIG